jgi:hypothetical protein
MSGRTAAAALIAVALLAASSAADSYASRAVPNGFFGVVWDGPVKDKGSPAAQDREWQRMKDSGVESVRTAFDWSVAQPTRESNIRFDQTDQIVGLAAAHGLDVLPVVFTPPHWARRGDAENSPPKHPVEYADFLVALIGRYGPDGSFWAANPNLPKRPIRDWQLWNEPSLRQYWNIPEGEDWAPGYGELVRVGHDAIKHADPGARVVLAGLTYKSWKALGRLYKRGGIKGKFDVAAVHPYTAQSHGPRKIVRLFRAVMADHGDGGKPLWVTELGLPASLGKTNVDTPIQTTKDGMLKFLKQSYADLVAGRSKSATRVDRAYWYTWASTYKGNDNVFAYSGLVRYRRSGGVESADPLPVLDAYRKAALAAEGR